MFLKHLSSFKGDNKLRPYPLTTLLASLYTSVQLITSHNADKLLQENAALYFVLGEELN